MRDLFAEAYEIITSMNADELQSLIDECEKLIAEMEEEESDD